MQEREKAVKAYNTFGIFTLEAKAAFLFAGPAAFCNILHALGIFSSSHRPGDIYRWYPLLGNKNLGLDSYLLHFTFAPKAWKFPWFYFVTWKNTQHLANDDLPMTF